MPRRKQKSKKVHRRGNRRPFVGGAYARPFIGGGLFDTIKGIFGNKSPKVVPLSPEATPITQNNTGFKPILTNTVKTEENEPKGIPVGYTRSSTPDPTGMNTGSEPGTPGPRRITAKRVKTQIPYSLSPVTVINNRPIQTGEQANTLHFKNANRVNVKRVLNNSRGSATLNNRYTRNYRNKATSFNNYRNLARRSMTRRRKN
jgi:hypothetical protein